MFFVNLVYKEKKITMGMLALLVLVAQMIIKNVIVVFMGIKNVILD